MASQKPERKSDAEKIRAAILRAYEYGYREGVNEVNKRLNCLRITNSYLWKELCRLDRNEPIEGVLLSVSFAEKLVDILPKKHSGTANELRKKIRLSNQRLNKLLRILEHFKGYK
ncbi:MAG: hypothetical protein ACFFCW_00620 [Candidatus Hodarchaeota archaeon]